MKLTDGRKTVEITMKIWNGNGYNPDWSKDFFNAGVLLYNEDADAHVVNDVDYCIECAKDWQNGTGDFAGMDSENNYVFVDFLD